MRKINLYIFSRRPEISVGKTRLKKRVGKIIGSNFYLNNLLNTIRIFYNDKRINLKICVNPDKAVTEWPIYIFPKIKRIPQGKGDLGEKMWNIINFDNKAKIITSIAMFYDLEDPNSFVSDVASLLSFNGVWCIQLSYLLSMIINMIFYDIKLFGYRINNFMKST